MNRLLAATPTNPRKILVIDDDPDFRQVVVSFLRKQGFELLAAANGKEGVSLAVSALPDLIVCDLAMPELDGYQVLAALRHEPKLADIPVIFLTGQSEPSQVRQGMNLGADDYLTKPVNLADLVGAVQARLNRRQGEQQRQQRQMERAMELFAGIVHDLRDPLFAVLGYSDLLKSATDGPQQNEERSREILDRMQQGILRMQAIISETLSLARSRMRRLPFDPGAFNLRELCEQLLREHEGSGRVQFNCAAGPFPIVADALRLRQALENLLSNALKYSDGSVQLRLACVEQGYQIQVIDTGIGIPTEDHRRIFEPFFRASNTGGKPGHGLGLSVVQSCIEQHGGSIHFTSQSSRGTTFTIHLPTAPRARSKIEAIPAGDITESELKSVPSRSPAAPVRTGAERTGNVPTTASQLRGIIVDDDPLVRSVLRDLLESTHDLLIVGEAGTIAQARFLVRQQEPTVVFLDVNLPDGSGFDLLPDLARRTSVVFVTSAEDYAVHAFDCEATDYLLKPVSSQRLERALQRVRQRLPAPSATLPPRALSTPSDTFLIKTLTEKRLVKIGQIKSILAYGEYSWVYWDKSQKGALLRKSLKLWQSELPPEQFVRVHRRAIVNLAYLETVEKLAGGQVQLRLRDTAEPILVSLRLAPSLNRKLKAG